MQSLMMKVDPRIIYLLLALAALAAAAGAPDGLTTTWSIP
jgi:hypothetical protein